MKSLYYLLRGLVRIMLAITVLSLGTVAIVAVWWVPWRIQGIRPGGWLATGVSRTLLIVFGVQYCCERPETVRVHTGFIFPNHLSFLDIMILLAVWPVRFVSMADVRSYPFVGWIAWAIDTVFVDRSDKASRQDARQQVAQKAGTAPPIVLFPEGGISPDGSLLPFRYGAFEIAVHGCVPILPVVFAYDPLPVVGWTDEKLVEVLWRIAMYPGVIRAQMRTMRVVQPRPDDDSKRLALEMHGAMTAVITYAGHEDDLLRPDL